MAKSNKKNHVSELKEILKSVVEYPYLGDLLNQNEVQEDDGKCQVLIQLLPLVHEKNAGNFFTS